MTTTRPVDGEPCVPPGELVEADFTALVERYSGSVWRFAYSKLGDAHEAEDVTQETFLRAYRSLGGWRGDAALRTWVHSICRNLCIDRLRARRMRFVSLEVLAEDGLEPSVAATEARSILREALARAVTVLSDDEREAFLLVDALGFSGEDAAQICGVPATTLRSRLHRAHRKLVDELDRGDVE